MPDTAGRTISARQWSGLGDYLAGTDIRLLSEQARKRLLADWQEVARQEEQLDDALLIGLVGGTGVGKSTFINALAGEVVSRSSDRRPTTDRVVVYRHAETQLPDDIPTNDLAQPQVLHRREELTKVVLFDFPDFDSAERSHLQILEKYLEHLDVLLIVVDDMKYADRRLHDLLTSLDHSDANLFVLLNKIDRLQLRYAENTDQVVKNLAKDVRAKFAQNAGVILDSGHLFPISAGEVVRARTTGGPTPYLEGFQRVERLLTSFQEEKHRRRAKELNIDARKARLAEEVQHLALGDDNRSILVETRELLNQWQTELTHALGAIPQDILLERERRALRRSRMRRVAPQWGFPFSFAFTIFGEMPWSKRAEAMTDPSEMGARILQHYRGFFEAVRNLRARFSAEFVGTQVASEATPISESPEHWAAAMASTLRTSLQENERPVSRTSRMLAHVPGLALVFLAIWSCVYRMFDGEYGFFRGLGVALLSAINPTFLLGLALSVVVVYFIAAGVIWIREVQTLDLEIASAEQGIRSDVLDRREQVLHRLDENVTELSAEYDEVSALVE